MPQRLLVKVIQGSNFPLTERGNMPDPYCKICWNGKKYKTEVCKATLDPVWNASFTLPFGKGCRTTLVVDAWDHGSWTADQHLGGVDFDLNKLKVGKKLVETCDLINSTREGSIKLEFMLEECEGVGNETEQVGALSTHGRNKRAKICTRVDAGDGKAADHDVICELCRMIPHASEEFVAKTVKNSKVKVKKDTVNEKGDPEPKKNTKESALASFMDALILSISAEAAIAGLSDRTPDTVVCIPTVPSSGRTRALLIGISYKDSPERTHLKGCINDAIRMKELLATRYSFATAPGSLLVLTDDQTKDDLKPTGDNIYAGISWLTKNSKYGDSLFFYYSGHGTTRKINKGTILDGVHEAICPSDFKANGVIIDYYLHQTLVDPLKEGTRLTAVVDACHSGTIMDLPFNYERRSAEWQVEPNTSYSQADVTCISGCLDTETSSDMRKTFRVPSGGALTLSLYLALSVCPFGHTFKTLLQDIQSQVERFGCAQHICLSSTQEFDPNRAFNFTSCVRNLNSRNGPTPKGGKKQIKKTDNDFIPEGAKLFAATPIAS